MTKCNIMEVPKDCCYIHFGKGKRSSVNNNYNVSSESYETIRGEELIVDFDKEGKVIGIELLSSPEAIKPCQSSE